MKFMDQRMLDKLVVEDLVEPDTIQELITANCKWRKFEDLDCEFVCGFKGSYEMCKCRRGELCDEFEPEDGFETLLHDVLSEL